MSASTDGAKPTPVARESFILPNVTSATLFLESWVDNGCPIQRFEIEYRSKEDLDWVLVSNSVDDQKQFVVRSLLPNTEYNVRVRAHNSAGSTVMEYTFRTLSKPG